MKDPEVSFTAEEDNGSNVSEEDRLRRDIANIYIDSQIRSCSWDLLGARRHPGITASVFAILIYI
jgi:hypothetical protein